MSVMMSDMGAPKDEFTARELSRHTGEVLAAIEVFGSVTIRSRNGKSYEIRMTKSDLDAKPNREDLEARFRTFDQEMAALSYEPPSDAEFEKLDAMIAGDE